MTQTRSSARQGAQGNSHILPQKRPVTAEVHDELEIQDLAGFVGFFYINGLLICWFLLVDLLVLVGCLLVFVGCLLVFVGCLLVFYKCFGFFWGGKPLFFGFLPAVINLLLFGKPF